MALVLVDPWCFLVQSVCLGTIILQKFKMYIVFTHTNKQIIIEIIPMVHYSETLEKFKTPLFEQPESTVTIILYHASYIYIVNIKLQCSYT